MKPIWIIDKNVTGRLESQVRLEDVAIELGYEVHTSELTLRQYIDDPFQDAFTDISNQEEPVVLYGSHQMVRHIQQKYKFLPGGYGLTENLSAQFYYTNLPRDWMMNNDFIILPWREFTQRKDSLHQIYGGEGDNKTDGIFVRPIAGTKTFAGGVIKWDDWDDEINTLNQLSSVVPETLVLIAGMKDIQAEYRFVIGNKEVITGSQYRWDGKLDIRYDVMPEASKLAEKMAEHSWQPDIAYVADVALTKNGPKIVELNSFCCAGLYACNKYDIVEKISTIAVKDFLGEL